MRVSTSSSVIATALLGLASAQTTHIITVSTPAGDIIFTPNNVKANVGDKIQWQYVGGNHSITQADFDHPCTPIGMHEAGKTGLFSGFEPVASFNGSIPTYTGTLTTSDPLWFYCAQDHHCQGGMVMVVNEDTAANATRSLENFKTLAATVPNTIFPDEVTIGQASNAGITDDVKSFISPSLAIGIANNSTNLQPSSLFVRPTGTGTAGAPGSTSTGAPKKGAGSAVSVSSWTGLLGAVAAALASL